MLPCPSDSGVHIYLEYVSGGAGVEGKLVGSGEVKSRAVLAVVVTAGGS